VSRILVALWVLALVASAGALVGVVPWAVAGAAGLVLSGAIVVISYKDDPASFHRNVTKSDVRRTSVTVAIALAVIIAVVVVANH
jgi:xanthine/uracil permease